MEDRYHGMTDTICCLFSNYKRKFCGSFCKNVGTSIYFFFPQVPQELCLPPIKNYYQNKLPCDNLEKLNETDTNKCICVSHFLDKPKSDINHHISPFFFFFPLQRGMWVSWNQVCRHISTLVHGNSGHLMKIYSQSSHGVPKENMNIQLYGYSKVMDNCQFKCGPWILTSNLQSISLSLIFKPPSL